MQKVTGSEVSTTPVAPCGNLWLLGIHALLHSNLKELLRNQKPVKTPGFKKVLGLIVSG